MAIMIGMFLGYAVGVGKIQVTSLDFWLLVIGILFLGVLENKK